MGVVARLSIAALALALSGLACQRTQEVHTVNDADLVNAVRATFAADHDTQGATSQVQIHAKDGVITLSGTVDTTADKTLAEQATRRTAGVVNVVNQITVAESQTGSPEVAFDERAVREEALKSGERIGTSSDDARIYDAVRRKLVAHEGTSKKEIFVDVVDRDVTLRGRFVGTGTARNEAVAAARTVPGVKAVNDKLIVRASTSRP
jgi:osmotically-inducible protein OsmY